VFRVSGTNLHRWLIPCLYAAVLFGVLLFVFPFDTGYLTERTPLGFALWQTWTASDPNAQDYSYCLLVPFIVGYLVYERKGRLAETPVKGSTWAIAVILLGLFLFWVGSRAGKQFIGCGAIQVLLAGTILWFWGGKVFRLLLFAWAMITFAWPLTIIDSSIAFPLRMTVSTLANGTLNFLGIHSVRNGTAILSAADIPAVLKQGDRFQIDIADPCSGIHSLLALLMFSALYSYFFLPRFWQQWLVFLSAIPLTIIGNVVRILLLVIGCIAVDMTFAIGTNAKPSWFHEACGFVVFGVVLGLEFLLGSGLLALEKKWTGKPPQEHPEPLLEEAPKATTYEIVPQWRGWVVLGLTGMMMISFLLRSPPELPPEAGVVMELPNQVFVPNLPGGKFSGLYASVSEAEQRILPKDTEFARKNYDDFHGHEIFFSIVLSGLQQYSIHRPEVCLQAQGWRIDHEEDMAVRLASGRDLTVRNLTVEHDSMGPNHEMRIVKSYFMYWYVAEGLSTPSHTERNLISSWDRVVYNRNHRWAYIFAMSPITASVRADGLDADQTRKMMTDFLCQIIPVVQKSEFPAAGTPVVGG
jgi:EpsI family protein